VIILSTNYHLDGNSAALRPHASLSEPFDVDMVVRTVAAACLPAD
jgi:hypothetical protein